jgi:hypothetical protein
MTPSSLFPADSKLIWNIPSREGHTSFRLVVDAAAEPFVGALGMVQGPLLQGSFSNGQGLMRERVLELLALRQRASLWRRHLLNPSAPTDVDAISETVDSILDAVALFGPEHVDLSALDLTFANAEHVVAVLRATFMWRAAVPGWRATLAATPDLLTQCGLSPASILKGLDQ